MERIQKSSEYLSGITMPGHSGHAKTDGKEEVLTGIQLAVVVGQPGSHRARPEIIRSGQSRLVSCQQPQAVRLTAVRPLQNTILRHDVRSS